EPSRTTPTARPTAACRLSIWLIRAWRMAPPSNGFSLDRALGRTAREKAIGPLREAGGPRSLRAAFPPVRRARSAARPRWAAVVPLPRPGDRTQAAEERGQTCRGRVVRWPGARWTPRVAG